MPVPWDEGDLAYSGPDVEKLKPILDELEFKTMAPRIYGLLSGDPAPVVAAAAAACHHVRFLVLLRKE